MQCALQRKEWALAILDLPYHDDSVLLSRHLVIIWWVRWGGPTSVRYINSHSTRAKDTTTPLMRLFQPVGTTILRDWCMTSRIPNPAPHGHRLQFPTSPQTPRTRFLLVGAAEILGAGLHHGGVHTLRLWSP